MGRGKKKQDKTCVRQYSVGLGCLFDVTDYRSEPEFKSIHDRKGHYAVNAVSVAQPAEGVVTHRIECPRCGKTVAINSQSPKKVLRWRIWCFLLPFLIAPPCLGGFLLLRGGGDGQKFGPAANIAFILVVALFFASPLILYMFSLAFRSNRRLAVFIKSCSGFNTVGLTQHKLFYERAYCRDGQG